VDVPQALRRDQATLHGGTHGNRDAGRTPMRWDATPDGGFTGAGVTPWLPMTADTGHNVAGERADPDSVMWLCRRLLALRRAELGHGIAAYQALPAGTGQWVYRAGPLLVAANFTDQQVEMPAGAGEVLLASSRPLDPAPGTRTIEPWSGVVTRAS
jgi:glycosidase